MHHSECIGRDAVQALGKDAAHGNSLIVPAWGMGV